MSQEASLNTVVVDSKDDIVHYQYLDALRGIAALLVLSVHISVLSILVGGRGFGLGAYGVQLFYILSAFTLFLSSSKRFSSEDRPVSKFFIRRFFRIAPLFYLTVIVAFLFTNGIAYRLPVEGISLGNIVAHFFFIFGFNKYWINSVIGVEWSIFCEVFFYLSLPFVFKYIKSKKRALYLLVFSLFVYFVFKGSIYLFNSGGDLLLTEWSSVFILSNYFYFALGIFLYFIIGEAKNINRKFIYLGWLLFFSGVSLMLIFSVPHFGALLFSVFAFLLALLMSMPLNINTIFNNKFTRFIGKISYSMYLWHFLILIWLAKYIIEPYYDFFAASLLIRLLAIVSVVSLIILISWISYLLIENPGINLGKRLIKKMKPLSLKSEENFQPKQASDLI